MISLSLEANQTCLDHLRLVELAKINTLQQACQTQLYGTLSRDPLTPVSDGRYPDTLALLQLQHDLDELRMRLENNYELILIDTELQKLQHREDAMYRGRAFHHRLHMRVVAWIKGFSWPRTYVCLGQTQIAEGPVVDRIKQPIDPQRQFPSLSDKGRHIIATLRIGSAKRSQGCVVPSAVDNRS
ncbi:hypothetical protein MRB53_040847 [Persea americana]|nr:hypothetical protein MRB53_040847 [Persea americana]